MSNEQMEPLLSIEHLSTRYPVGNSVFGRTARYKLAVDDVTLQIYPGETLGLVGESGCGKSTLGRSVLRLEEPFQGRVLYNGQDILSIPARKWRPLRKELQIIFQDPASSLNPRQKVGSILREPLIVNSSLSRQEIEMEVDRMLELTGLPRSAKSRYPNEFSGGQKQRIGIARSLMLKPRFLVCDEPVSALDISVQAQILNFMIELQREMGLAYLFIAHGLGTVRYISQRVAVMYLGRIVETGAAEDLIKHPFHPYTELLISSYPIPDPGKRRERKDVRAHAQPEPSGQGCAFAARCPYAKEICKSEKPPLRTLKDAQVPRQAACHSPLI